MKFLEQITYRLIDEGLDNLRNYTIVFPMHRAGEYIKNHLRRYMLDHSVEKPVLLPSLVTIDELVDSLCPYRPDDEIRSVCKLYNAFYRKEGEYFRNLTHNELTLDIFYGWGRQMLNDFSNVDMSLVNPDNLFTNAAAAQKLEQIDLHEETRQRLEAELTYLMGPKKENRVPEFFEHLWNNLPELYHVLQQDIADTSEAYKGARYRYVIEHFDQLRDKVQQHKYIFVGFNYLLNAERRLLELFRDNFDAFFCWDTASLWKTNPGAGQFIRENIELFGNAITPEPELSEPRPVNIVKCVSNAAQAQFVHDWLLKNHRQGQKTAIVIADENQLEQVIYSIPQAYSGQINITKGYPLRNTRVYADVLNWMNSNAKDDNQIGQLSPVELLTNLINQVLSDGESAGNDTENRTTWQHALVMESLYQTRLVINRLIGLLQDDTLQGITTLKTLRFLLRRQLESVSLPFHGNPVTDIQIIGVLETRLLDFDNVLVLNVEEGVVPANSNDSSFIPYYLRRYYRMQTFEEEALIYSYNFFRLMRRPQIITLTFAEASEGGGKRTMSRFLMQMMTSPKEFVVAKSTLTESEQMSEMSCEPASEEIRNYKEVAVLRNKQYAEEHNCTPADFITLSPSAVSTYIACARRFFYQNVLEIKQPVSRETIMPVNDLGTLVHNMLEYAYTTMAGGCFPAKITGRRIQTYLSNKENVTKALDAAYADLNKRYPVSEGEPPLYRKDEHLAENLVAEEQFRRVMEVDAGLEYLEIIALEYDFRYPLKVCDMDVLIGGVIDRLDVIKENGQSYLRILDYKTGRYDETKLSFKDYADLLTESNKKYILQTLLYAQVCDYHIHHPKEGRLVYDRYRSARKYESEYIALDKYGDLPIMPQLMFTQKASADRHLVCNFSAFTFDEGARNDFVPAFEQKVKDILTTTSFDKSPDEKNCTNCPFALLCNRDSRSAFY